MKPAFRPRRLHPAAWPALLGLAVSGVATAEDGTLQRCRAITDAGARLACYDALPLRSPPAAAPAGPSAAPPAAPPVAPSAAVAPPPASQTFGQPRKDEPTAITSHIPGLFEGWGPRTRFTLANGQVWQVVDDSSGVYALKDPKVTLRRAMMGGYVLDIEGANRVPKVRRVD